MGARPPARSSGLPGLSLRGRQAVAIRIPRPRRDGPTPAKCPPLRRETETDENSGVESPCRDKHCLSAAPMRHWEHLKKAWLQNEDQSEMPCPSLVQKKGRASIMVYRNGRFSNQQMTCILQSENRPLIVWSERRLVGSVSDGCGAELFAQLPVTRQEHCYANGGDETDCGPDQADLRGCSYRGSRQSTG